MQHKSNFKSQVFNDFKEIINTFSLINSVEELLQQAYKFDEIQDLFTTLKVLEKYPDTFSETEVIDKDDATNELKDDITDKVERVINEEFSIHNENNADVEITENIILDIEESADKEEDDNTIIEELKEDVIEEEYLEEEEEILDELDNLEEQEPIEENVLEQEQELMDELEKLEEEIAKAEEELAQNSEPITKEEKENKKEKEKNLCATKVRLAHIKGLKPLVEPEPLFDKETLDKLVQVKEEKESAPKVKKQDFKLDLNDKIAFSKILFDGRQSELNETITILNSFDTIEQAQEYLSDIYYKKHWEKVDEYAQRLWSLVENKFQ